MSQQQPVPDRSSPAPRRSQRQVVPGKRAQADDLELRSYEVGALPLLNRIVERMQLQRILSDEGRKDGVAALDALRREGRYLRDVY